MCLSEYPQLMLFSLQCESFKQFSAEVLFTASRSVKSLLSTPLSCVLCLNSSWCCFLFWKSKRLGFWARREVSTKKKNKDHVKANPAIKTLHHHFTIKLYNFPVMDFSDDLHPAASSHYANMLVSFVRRKYRASKIMQQDVSANSTFPALLPQSARWIIYGSADGRGAGSTRRVPLGRNNGRQSGGGAQFGLAASGF